MEGQAASRPRALLFGGAVSTCVVLACVVLSGGGTAAGSAAPVAAATDVPPPPTTTVTVFTTVPVYTPSVIFETVFTTKVVLTTSTAHTTTTERRTGTGATPATPAASPPVTLTLQPTASGATVTIQRQAIASKGNDPPPITVTGTPVTITAANPAVSSRTDASSMTARLRLAAGAAGLAVTSAAGFGFLLLRRRGRYGL